jgi:hypothetical protein
MVATPAWPPKSAPRPFVPGPLAEGAHVPLEGGQAHYLGKVMRVGPGDAVILCDDQTGEWLAEVSAAGKRDVTLAVVRRLREREAVPDFWLCAALIKKDRFDLVLEKATELGVGAIHPVSHAALRGGQAQSGACAHHRDGSGRAMRPHRAARAGGAREAGGLAARLADRTAAVLRR